MFARAGDTGDQRQKLYGGTQGNMLKLARDQLTGNIRVYLQHSAEGEVISGQHKEKTHFVEALSTSETYLCEDRN